MLLQYWIQIDGRGSVMQLHVAESNLSLNFSAHFLV